MESNLRSPSTPRQKKDNTPECLGPRVNDLSRFPRLKASLKRKKKGPRLTCPSQEILLKQKDVSPIPPNLTLSRPHKLRKMNVAGWRYPGLLSVGVLHCLRKLRYLCIECSGHIDRYAFTSALGWVEP
jgi:hypothetical protein